MKIPLRLKQLNENDSVELLLTNIRERTLSGLFYF